MFKIYERDPWTGSDTFSAYGMCCLPNTPGVHDLTAWCWRPLDNRNPRRAQRAYMHSFFTGLRPSVLPEVEDLAILRDSAAAMQMPIDTVGVGQVHVRVQLMFR